jgi:protein arginine N-methyltransferase 1
MATHQSIGEASSKDYYFDSYSHYGIHEEMLKDEVRTNAYKHAITRNKHLFRDKIVLDVGCGTGILSMFAAKAGAKKVIAVECAGIADSAAKIVKLNHLDHIVTVVKSKLEDIVELPEGIKHVDIIISEWMGYMLLYESMLDSVLYARDRWLTKDGLLFPDQATLYVCAIEDEDYKNEKVHFWDDVYGFDMSCMKPLVMAEPLVDNVEASMICTDSVPIYSIDLKTVKKEDLAFKAPYELTVQRNDYVHALVTYFDVTFSACHRPFVLTTDPHAKHTHWKQTVFYLNDVLTVNKGEKLKGEFACKPNEHNHRDMDINVTYQWSGENGLVNAQQEYRLR